MGNNKNSRKRKKRNRHTVGKILAVIQIILSIVFMAVLLMLNVLPLKYLAIIFGILMFLDAFALGSQYTRSAHVIGKVDCVLMLVLLVLANVYLIRTNATLLSITNNDYKIDRIAIAVLNDDAAQTLQEAANYDFGAQVISGSDKVSQAITEAEGEVGQELSCYNYEDPYAMVQDLYNGSVQGIIYNSAFDSSLTELFVFFSTDIREL